MSTFLNIVNDVLRRTGQDTVLSLEGASTPVVQTMHFINDVYQEILQSAECKFLEARETLETENATALYTLANDADPAFLLTDRIRELSADRYLTEVDPALMLSSRLEDEGKPVRFWIEGDQLRLHPVPNDVYTIEYYYLKRPSVLTDDADETLIPMAWERLLVRGAQSLLEKFLGETESSRFTYGLYLEGLSLLRSKAQVKPYHVQKPFYRGYQP